MQEKIVSLCEKFNKYGKLLDFTIFTSGHINSTYYAKLNIEGKEKEFVIQRINHNVFKNPDKVMENISNVTNHIKNKIWSTGGHTSRRVLKFYPSVNGKYYYQDENGDYWRMYKYITNSSTFNNTPFALLFFNKNKAESAIAFPSISFP